MRKLKSFTMLTKLLNMKIIKQDDQLEINEV